MKYYRTATAICVFILGVGLGVQLYSLELERNRRPTRPAPYIIQPKPDTVKSYHPSKNNKNESQHSQYDTTNQDTMRQFSSSALSLEKQHEESQTTHSKSQMSKRTITDTISYDSYNRYGLDWMGKVVELEWAESHSTHSTGTRQKRTLVNFDVGVGSLGLTSADNTKFKLYGKETTLKKGSIVHVVMETYDIHGNAKRRGGDFFSAVMSNDELQKYTSGRVMDYGNGTYSVFFYAAWTGDAYIYVSLVLFREEIDFVVNVIKESKVLHFRAQFVDGETREYVNCQLENNGLWKDKCTYTNHNSLGITTTIACNKPNKLGCDKMYDLITIVSELNELILEEIEGVQYLFDGKYHQTMITGSPMKVKITDCKLPSPTLPVCGPDLPIPITDGYWENNVTFIPMVCQSKQWSQIEANKCLSNKLFKIYGDSTSEQVQRRLFGALRSYSNIEHQFIAPRLGGGARLVNNMVMESDYLDSLPQEACTAKQLIVILNFAFHFRVWSNRSFLERIFHAREAVKRLMRRCHDNVLIFIKMAHPPGYGKQSVRSSNWTYYALNRMIRSVFGGIGVHFWELWDLVDSHPSPNVVHVSKYLLDQQVQLLFSYICPKFGAKN